MGEMALHFCEKYGLMVVKMPSKFELARLCRATGATARATFGAPTTDELGFAKSLRVQVWSGLERRVGRGVQGGREGGEQAGEEAGHERFGCLPR